MHTCRACGAELARDHSAEPICPACLLRLGIDQDDLDEGGAGTASIRVIGPLGRGPHGTVYLGSRAPGAPRFVTIKVVDARLETDRFAVQIEALTIRLRDAAVQGVVPILESGLTAGGKPYVVSSFVIGSSLEPYVARTRRNADRLRAVADRLSALVSGLHRSGVVHGSIKSSNVIVTDSPQGPVPVLLDTGVVPAIESARVVPNEALKFEISTDVRALESLLRNNLLPFLQ
jgi:serine/threonine protein kinase